MHSLANESTCLAARALTEAALVAAASICKSNTHIYKISHTFSEQSVNPHIKICVSGSPQFISDCMLSIWDSGSKCLNK
jgi:dissimilatory sulfite reductase (desulfoviridin) alpha/beta subunit